MCDFLLVINSNLATYLAPFSHNTSVTDGQVGDDRQTDDNHAISLTVKYSLTCFLNS